MTATQLALYIFIFGSPPCPTGDAHYCHGTPVAYTQALPPGGRENGGEQRSTPAAQPEPPTQPDPPERCE